jgi:hypothetical protein
MADSAIVRLCARPRVPGSGLPSYGRRGAVCQEDAQEDRLSSTAEAIPLTG